MAATIRTTAGIRTIGMARGMAILTVIRRLTIRATATATIDHIGITTSATARIGGIATACTGNAIIATGELIRDLSRASGSRRIFAPRCFQESAAAHPMDRWLGMGYVDPEITLAHGSQRPSAV